MTSKQYEKKYDELHSELHEIVRKSQEAHIKLLEIEDKMEKEEAETGKEGDYSDEHFELTMDLAYNMRDYVDVNGRMTLLTMEYQGKIKPDVLN